MSSETIAIRTQSGFVDLVPKGTVLPWPANGEYEKHFALEVPSSSLLDEQELRVEIVSREDERVLFSGCWKVPPPVNRGDKITLEYRFDENQVLSLRMYLAERDDQVFVQHLEHPLSNVVNQQAEKIEIEELEEKLRTCQIDRERIPDVMVKLANKYSDIGQHEKALAYVGKVMRVKNVPDAELLNKMAIICGEMGDQQREEKFYREAAKVATWSGPWFNLALLQERRKQTAEAYDSVNRAIQMEHDPPYLVLEARLAGKLGKVDSRRRAGELLETFDPVPTLSDWQLGWLITAAKMAGDTTIEIEGLDEQRKRKRSTAVESSGELPLAQSGIMRRQA